MSAGPVVMLLGLFAVPTVLLWLGHRLRRRTARQRGAFWGALVGHIAAVVLATLASMLPPQAWGPDDLVRGLASYAALLVLPIIGGAVGAFTAPQEDDSEA
ncbi:MAG: hypothetical protein ACYC2G_10195 [Gemmatimonadaceae bacterium]